MSAVLGCAAQDFAAGPRFAGERPTAADWRWRSAAEQRGWPEIERMNEWHGMTWNGMEWHGMAWNDME